LRRVADKYSWRCPLDPEDLLQEAFRRALEEREGRKCPAHVDVVKFLAEAMRSIADGEAEKIEYHITFAPIAQHGDQQEKGAVDPEDSSPNAEDKITCEQHVAAMLALFQDDPVARDLLEGIMGDFDADELRELTGLDKTAYASKRRLIRRTIDKHYPGGWKP
jgi:RNA polymerase sigma-70 factor (ECF subfamily)